MQKADSISVTSLLGKRCLMKVKDNRYYRGSEVQEFRVLEISPSGNYIKLMNIYGNKFWKSIADISFIELLIDLKAERQKEVGSK